jgi:hypothetical protein
MEITPAIAAKVLETVDAGLIGGIGKPVPGQMCVEAAVCYAMGLPHSDEPACVAPSLRRLKINLNDKSWSSAAARAKGLRRLALAQLGSAGHLDEPEFARRVAKLAITSCAAKALRSAAKFQKDQKHIDALEAAADRCEREGTIEAARDARKTADAAAYAAEAAYAADAYAADAAAYAAERDRVLSEFAEEVVQILIEMKAPGCQWLSLTEIAA